LVVVYIHFLIAILEHFIFQRFLPVFHIVTIFELFLLSIFGRILDIIGAELRKFE